MSLLLREIKHVDIRAARVFEDAGVGTNSELLALTREDLRDLFPGIKNFQLRKKLYDTIHKQPVEELLKRLKGFIPRDSLKAALTSNGVLVDYLHLLKDMKTQMNGQMSFIDAHIGLLEEFSADQPDSRQTDRSQEAGSGASDAGGPKCKQNVPTDGYPLERQSPSAPATGGPVGPPGVQSGGGDSQSAQGYGASDSGNQMVLHAGSTGGHSLGTRNKQQGPSAPATGGPVGPPGAQSGGGDSQSAQGYGASDASDQMMLPAGEYSQGTYGYGASYSGNQMVLPAGSTGGHSLGTKNKQQGYGASYSGNQMVLPAGSTGGHSLGTKNKQQEPFTFLSAQDCVEPKLLCKMIVGGKTFDHHLTLLEKLNEQVPNRIQFCDDKQDYKLTLVFCPISSRIGADVEAAMAAVNYDKPIILVLMHHAREVKPVTSMKTWSEAAKVVLRVDVFFHETTGLLKCYQNDAAVAEIKNKLLESFIQGSNDTGGNAEGADRKVADGKSSKWPGAGLFSRS